jgi:hypothetical protein
MHRRNSLRHLSESGMSHLGPHLSHLSPSSTNTGILAGFIDIFFPRKSRQRATVLCLMSLVVLTTYVCLVSPPALSPGQSPHRHRHPSPEDAWRQLVENLPKPPHGGFHNHQPEIVLSPEQELGALTAFMAALPQNVIPPDVDPTRPIDPQLVLDFDTRSPRAEEEVDNIVSEAWFRNPVVVFSKVKCLSHSPSQPYQHTPTGRLFFSRIYSSAPFFLSRSLPCHVSSRPFWMPCISTHLLPSLASTNEVGIPNCVVCPGLLR